jgi:hypothetical protein
MDVSEDGVSTDDIGEAFECLYRLRAFHEKIDGRLRILRFLLAAVLAVVLLFLAEPIINLYRYHDSFSIRRAFESPIGICFVFALLISTLIVHIVSLRRRFSAAEERVMEALRLAGVYLPSLGEKSDRPKLPEK